MDKSASDIKPFSLYSRHASCLHQITPKAKNGITSSTKNQKIKKDGSTSEAARYVSSRANHTKNKLKIYMLDACSVLLAELLYGCSFPVLYACSWHNGRRAGWSSPRRAHHRDADEQPQILCGHHRDADERRRCSKNQTWTNGFHKTKQNYFV